MATSSSGSARRRALYLAVGDLRRVALHGLAGARHRDEVRGGPDAVTLAPGEQHTLALTIAVR